MPPRRTRNDRQIQDHERSDFGRRIKAARLLRQGMKKEALQQSYNALSAALGERKDLPKSDIDHWERLDQDASFAKLHENQQQALCAALGVGEEWFTEPLEKLLHVPEDGPLRDLLDAAQSPSAETRSSGENDPSKRTRPARG